MSVECNKIKGFTVELPIKNNSLNSDNFHKYYEFLDENPEYEFNGFASKPNKVYLITDGMAEEYVRIVYAEHTGTGYDYNEDEEQYYSLKQKELSEDVYDKLNEAYLKLMGENLPREIIDYALWYYWW